MNRVNWDDLRFVLAVAETGSVNRAGLSLGVTHATVLRRISAFEEYYGEAVFRRSATGYELLPGKMKVIEDARRVQELMLSVERDLKGEPSALRGQVRITSTDSLCLGVLPKMVCKITDQHPDLQLTLLSANKHLDFMRLSADIAVRPSVALDPALLGVRVGTLGFAVYESTKGSAGWLALGGTLAQSQPAKWLAANIPTHEVSQTADSFLVLQELVAVGGGRSFLPCFIGDRDKRLKRAKDQPKLPEVPLWVAVQRELAESVRLKVVSDLLAAEFKAIASSLSGENSGEPLE